MHVVDETKSSITPLQLLSTPSQISGLGPLGHATGPLLTHCPGTSNSPSQLSSIPLLQISWPAVMVHGYSQRWSALRSQYPGSQPVKPHADATQANLA